MSEQTNYPPAGWERDKLIAEKLGIHVITWTARDGAVAGGTLRDQDGGDFYGLLTGENYWLETQDPWGDCPRFSTDLNVAWLLLNSIDAEITIKNSPDGQKLLIRFWDGVWFGDFSAPPAAAISESVLKWYDAKTKDGA